MGQRPVVEMQFADFIACAFDQIVNMVAKFRYRTGTNVPLVIRGPSAAGARRAVSLASPRRAGSSTSPA